MSQPRNSRLWSPRGSMILIGISLSFMLLFDLVCCFEESLEEPRGVVLLLVAILALAFFGVAFEPGRFPQESVLLLRDSGISKQRAIITAELDCCFSDSRGHVIVDD